MKSHTDITDLTDREDLPLFYAPGISSDLYLPEHEAGHALRVLRLTSGSYIHIADGQGTLYMAEIVQIDRRGCSVSILDTRTLTPYWSGRLCVAIAPTKQMERMEWLCEKMVEIGIDQIVCLRTEHSERKQIRPDRLERIAISAMKQSLKATLPQIETEVKFGDFITRSSQATKLIAHCISEGTDLPPRCHMHELYTNGSATILIGPEGDFSPAEVAAAIRAGYAPLTLGHSRLRTETAALTALQWIHMVQTIRKGTSREE